MKKHFVTFFRPGTFVAEETTKEIASWNIEKAKKMSETVKKRYGATPYAFQFITRARSKKDLDSKIIKRSGMYYLSGRIWTLLELKNRNNPEDKILMSNMECNRWERVIENNNSWKWIQPFYENDQILRM